MRPWLKALVAIALVLGLTFSHTGDALAAGAGGGRMGGGSFRAPMRSYSPPRSYSAPRTYAPGGYNGGFGGSIGFPFIFPFLGLGGGFGGLFSILIFVAVANFLVQSFRNTRGENGIEGALVDNSTISVARVQVGLLANARELQADLNKLALKADTSSTTGLANVLQETTLALLRHPEYWAYAGSSLKKTGLASAETEFNRLALTERSKFSRETLSNVGSQIKQVASSDALTVSAGSALAEPGEYIVVTLLVGTSGALSLPEVKTSSDLKAALHQLGGVAGDRLLALEVLWTPQASGDVLTSDDLLVEYANLRQI